VFSIESSVPQLLAGQKSVAPLLRTQLVELDKLKISQLAWRSSYGSSSFPAPSLSQLIQLAGR